MKRIQLLILVLLPLVFSCGEEEFQPTKSVLDSESRALRPTCNVLGGNCASPGSIMVLNYSSDFVLNDVSWSVQFGDISIEDGQGTSTVVLKIGEDFNGGSILVRGSGNNGFGCDQPYVLSKCATDPPKCNPPTEIEIKQLSGACKGDLFTFRADPNGSTDNGTYQWYARQGATIDSGQGTATVSIKSPSSGGFMVLVDHVNDCMNTAISGRNLAQFDASCDDGGFGGGFGF